MNISRSLDHCFRSAISGWYSGELYQALSEFMSGNSKIPTSSGIQWPPSGSLCVPPFVKLRPPCFVIIGRTLTRYSSNFAASVILCSTIKYAVMACSVHVPLTFDLKAVAWLGSNHPVLGYLLRVTTEASFKGH